MQIFSKHSFLFFVRIRLFALSENVSYFLLVNIVALVVELQLVFRAAHAENAEPVDLGDELGRTLGHEVRVGLEEDVGKARAEVGAVDVELLLPRNVDVLAPGAVDFDPGGRKLLGNADGQHVLPFAEDAGAVAERAQHVFLLHHRQAAGREYKARVDQSVEVHRTLVYF